MICGLEGANMWLLQGQHLNFLEQCQNQVNSEKRVPEFNINFYRVSQKIVRRLIKYILKNKDNMNRLIER